jgi:cell wall-associated NlpC family hydrolase
MIDYNIVNSFIGRPWVYLEFDCYSLVKEASKKIFDVEIKDSISFPKTSNDALTTELFNTHKEQQQWQKVNVLSPGDVILFFNRRRNPVHIGLFIEHGNVLHCLGGEGVRNGKARYDSISTILTLYPTFESYRYIK